MKRLFIILVGLATFGCVGTDLIDDAIVPEDIEINEGQLSLLVGGASTLSATYQNQFGITSDTLFVWESEEPSIASVDNEGIVTAIAEGQTFVSVRGGGAVSTPLLVTVRQTVNDIAKVLVTEPEKFQFEIGETLQLEATGWNVDNSEIPDVEVEWEVSDPDVAQVDETGLFTALSNGEVIVTAVIDEVRSEEEVFMVGREQRSGSFVPVGGYTAEGSAVLTTNEQGDVILELSSDFSTSFALGTFIYLSNSTNGRETRSAGLDLGEIRTGGAKTFNVSSVEEDVELETYRYVIILCRPAGLTFGFADFEE